jgi:multidrug efflux pump subunit AcrA (membrane-fusion protein)
LVGAALREEALRRGRLGASSAAGSVTVLCLQREQPLSSRARLAGSRRTKTEDKRTGASYYTIRIAVSDAEIARLRDLKIIPGMPVEVFVQTGSRTMLSYMLKPLTDQLARTFRES